jgi:hypothetical protein
MTRKAGEEPVANRPNHMLYFELYIIFRGIRSTGKWARNWHIPPVKGGIFVSGKNAGFPLAILK